MRTLKEIMNELPQERQNEINKRAQELIAEEMTFQDLRKARGLTQERMAEMMGIGQDNVSRMENRADMLVSTLRSYLAAMGGSLDMVVRFPDRPAVSLSSLFDADEKKCKPSEHHPA